MIVWAITRKKTLTPNMREIQRKWIKQWSLKSKYLGLYSLSLLQFKVFNADLESEKWFIGCFSAFAHFNCILNMFLFKAIENFYFIFGGTPSCYIILFQWQTFLANPVSHHMFFVYLTFITMCIFSSNPL